MIDSKNCAEDANNRLCRAALEGWRMDTRPANTYVKRMLGKKGSGEVVGMAFLRIGESNLGLEDLKWAEGDKESPPEADCALKPPMALREM